MLRTATIATVLLAALTASAAPAAGLPTCATAQLHVEVGLQGATGSLLGLLTFRNTGRSACTLHGPLRLVLLGPSGKNIPLRLVKRHVGPAGKPSVALKPGGAATAVLQLFNGCPHPGARLWVVLAAHEGRLALKIGPGGRCDLGSAPPAYFVGGFAALSTP